VQIAFQVTGEGPVDIVLAPAPCPTSTCGGTSRLSGEIEAWSSFARLIRFDKRGTGLSDRPTNVATLEERKLRSRTTFALTGATVALAAGAGGALAAGGTGGTESGPGGEPGFVLNFTGPGPNGFLIATAGTKDGAETGITSESETARRSRVS